MSYKWRACLDWKKEMLSKIKSGDILIADDGQKLVALSAFKFNRMAINAYSIDEKSAFMYGSGDIEDMLEISSGDLLKITARCKNEKVREMLKKRLKEQL